MLWQFARRIVRRFYPRRVHPLLDAPVEVEPRDPHFESCYRELLDEEQPGGVDPFLEARYSEGRRWREVIHRLGDQPRTAIKVLDLGAGNGAIELALVAGGDLAFSVESLWNESARRLHRAAEVPFRRVLADAAHLPFRAGEFDAVLCLETLEHLSRPQEGSKEMWRVLGRGGQILLTTPPRWRFALRPDPHFGIRGLALLPNPLQRLLARRRGFVDPHHFVDRLYASTAGVARLFREASSIEVLSRSRAPRRYFWDALVIRKN